MSKKLDNFLVNEKGYASYNNNDALKYEEDTWLYFRKSIDVDDRTLMFIIKSSAISQHEKQPKDYHISLIFLKNGLNTELTYNLDFEHEIMERIDEMEYNLITMFNSIDVEEYE